MLWYLAASILITSSVAEVIDAMLVLPSHIPVQLHFPKPVLPPPPHSPPPPYPNCSNQAIGRIIAMNIKKDARLAEKAIEVAVRERYPGPWYVSCSYEDLQFSKIAPNYCEQNNGVVFCYTFQPYQL